MIKIRLLGSPAMIEAATNYIRLAFKVRREEPEEPEAPGELVRRYFEANLIDQPRLTLDELTLLMSLLAMYQKEAQFSAEESSEVEILARKLALLGHLALSER